MKVYYVDAGKQGKRFEPCFSRRMRDAVAKAKRLVSKGHYDWATVTLFTVNTDLPAKDLAWRCLNRKGFSSEVREVFSTQKGRPHGTA